MTHKTKARERKKRKRDSLDPLSSPENLEMRIKDANDKGKEYGRKMLRRFYEPLSLLYTLDPVRGDRSKPDIPSEDSTGGILKNRRNFIDAIAYICAYKTGPTHVTAVALESKPDCVVVWVAANRNVQSHVVQFLHNVLSVVQNVVDRTEVRLENHLGEAALLQLSSIVLPFNAPRNFCYYRQIVQNTSEKCLRILSEGTYLEEDSNGVSGFVNWFQQNFSSASLCEADMEGLAWECYKSRKRFEVLKHFSGQGQRQRETFERLHSLLCKLGKHMRMCRQLISAATYLRQDFGLGFSIETVCSPVKRPIPLLEEDSTIERIANRMFAESNERELFLGRLKMIYGDSRLSKELARHYMSTQTQVHAEVLLIDYLDKRSKNFLDNNDKYIGCSKPACYLCKLYIDYHPGLYSPPPSHQKLYLAWRLPDIGEDEPAVRLDQQEKVLLKMIEHVRNDLKNEINSRLGRRRYHPDSTSGLSSAIDITEPKNDYFFATSDGGITSSRRAVGPADEGPSSSKYSEDAGLAGDLDMDEESVRLPARDCRTLRNRNSGGSWGKASWEEPLHLYQPSAVGTSPQRSLTVTSEYTSALWRKAQAWDTVPEVMAQQISLSPERFKVTVRCGEVQGSGEGQSKKTAKHLASREVCDRLGIRL